MASYNFGDIVLINFPFTNNLAAKKRPALVLKDTKDGDVIVCRITSKYYSTAYDVEVKSWQQCGLMLPSVIRVHKIATIESTMISAKLGQIDTTLMVEADSVFKNLL